MKRFKLVYVQQSDAMIPALWANESLATLLENMVAAQLVHRDFENVMASFGDTVNTRKPANFTARRKTSADAVTIQDATSTNIPVPLNQHVHTSFMIPDDQMSKSFIDLIALYLKPAIESLARQIDLIVLTQLHRFYGGAVGGHLTQLSSANSQQYLLETREALNKNNVPMEDRALIIPPEMETVLLQNTLFTAAQNVGDQGQALKTAALGQKFGFGVYMCQNTPSVAAGITSVAGAINNAGGYAKGYAGAITVDGFAGALAVGEWLDIFGDDSPYQITATVGAPATSITLDRPLRRAVADNAQVLVVESGISTTAAYTGSTNNSSGAGYAKPIAISAPPGGIFPKVGQLVSFGTDVTNRYAITQVDAANLTITLDVPLVANVANATPIRLGCAGQYGFAFHKNALALVVRPLKPAPSGLGAMSFTASANGVSVRATMTYNGLQQGTLVTLDMLCGIAVLDPLLGAVMLG